MSCLNFSHNIDDRNSNGKIFKISLLGKCLEENTLNISNLNFLPDGKDQNRFLHYFMANT